ncbi:hypothetical protein DQW89_26985 (plasmid) [Escherichia coli]|nr:hypothetical protein DQW89_26985 [Escherichia coli]
MLEQNLTVEMDNFGNFKPTISLDDFPRGLSEREAMLKLAEWLQRLSIVIEDNWKHPIMKKKQFWATFIFVCVCGFCFVALAWWR